MSVYFFIWFAIKNNTVLFDERGNSYIYIFRTEQSMFICRNYTFS